MMKEKKKERCCILHIIRIVFTNLTPLGRCFGNNLLNRISNSSRFENNEKSEQSGPTQQHKLEYNYYVRIKFRVIVFLFCCLPGMTCTLALSLSLSFSRHLGIHFKFWLLFLVFLLWLHRSTHFSNCVSPMLWEHTAVHMNENQQCFVYSTIWHFQPIEN